MNFKRFIKNPRRLAGNNQFNYVSLFSGAGLGDYGLKLAGGNCLAAVEIDPNRAAVHKFNIKARMWGNIRSEKDTLIQELEGQDIDLVVATPPCQSFSTANAKRGSREDPEHASRDARNHLFFEALYVIRGLKPKVVLFENVPNFLSRKVKSSNGSVTGSVHDFISASLSDYQQWANVLCFSTLGVPQRRKRSLAIFVRKDVANESGSFPDLLKPESWPNYPTNPPSNILQALADSEPLDSETETKSLSNSDFLHQVPTHSSFHYNWIKAIPPNSGKSAWHNPCHVCNDDSAPFGSIQCEKCGAVMINRPHIFDTKGPRAIKGFTTSYKRMLPNEIAPTITTASGAFSSDLKLHPVENRVLSVRECAKLQTIPYSFKWPAELNHKKGSLFREMIGEAVPPLVTYRFGCALSSLLR
ncbi:DNA cytosine methyltransferase [Methyloradius palustris]|uniref:Cytosine-specific methyltransferase n=1 Tax=Methyloradius palustris TaxID=2778876 RepID=A0A8D5FXW9_9PROT|nr:DNA cytosine methyltransferase [Methyloradius palustris]BCM24154.1 hypothetical protein ZMTM_04130 [Methyloradius palustris]